MVTAFSYDQCAPLTLWHSPLATSAARLGYQRQGGVSTVYGVSTEKTLWDHHLGL